MIQHRFVIIGAGIAGASIAYQLANALGSAKSILLLEREDQPGYHSTGRSAAVYTETYGPPTIRALTAASRSFFDTPLAGFSDGDLLHPLGLLLAGPENRRAKVEALFTTSSRLTPSVQFLENREVANLVPVLRPEWTAAGVYEPNAMSMDVAALHQGYLRGFAYFGGMVKVAQEALEIMRTANDWRIETQTATYRAATIINAAGAWADEVAKLVGLPPLGLIPKRRTMLVLPMPSEYVAASWPMFNDIDEKFYFKPDAGRLLASPEEETPLPPCDVQPDEYDVALTVDRIEKATTLKIGKIENRWAGLRSFFADGLPALGFDPRVEGFFWLAGQGGYGITTSDAMARSASAMLLDHEVPSDIVDKGVNVTLLDPERLISVSSVQS